MDEGLKKSEAVGVVKISDEVVSVIAALAADEIEGIEEINAGLAAGISQILGGKKNISKGVKVNVNEGSAAIDLYVVVRYGIRIPEVCEKVQKNVMKTVETITGLRVSAVNVYVQNVSIPKIEEKNSKEEKED
ncbi:Asp23/Gls24 family envelope stress response protein [Clostridium sp. KNHs214]|uniref:Asp23/Gls24 family envelope stress response protein n=1 Tax=Clostridium sp. KNHs214 TaxID=1540257 RepID=UPI000554881D|nr:Asp23/Gls24 family envelope stress response protein [Clostridium sp. KNHs214]